MTLTSARVKGNINPYQGMDNQEIVEPGGPQGPGNQEITPKKV